MRGGVGVELCPLCQVAAGHGTCTTCAAIATAGTPRQIVHPEFEPMTGPTREEQLRAVRDAMRRGVRRVERAGAVAGTVGVGFDHTATNGVPPYWARCKAQIGRAHRTFEVVGFDDAPAALEALADHLSDQRARARGRR